MVKIPPEREMEVSGLMNKEDIIKELNGRGNIDLGEVSWRKSKNSWYYDTSAHNNGLGYMTDLWKIWLQGIKEGSVEVEDIFIGKVRSPGGVVDWVNEVDKSWMMERLDELVYRDAPVQWIDAKGIARLIGDRPINKYDMPYVGTSNFIDGWCYSEWRGRYSGRKPHLRYLEPERERWALWVDNISSSNPPSSSQIYVACGDEWTGYMPLEAAQKAIAALPFNDLEPRAKCYRGFPRADPGHPRYYSIGETVWVAQTCWNVGTEDGVLVIIVKKDGEELIYKEQYVKMGTYHYENPYTVRTSFIMPNESVNLEFIVCHLKNGEFVKDCGFFTNLIPK
ncbi:MAG: hypothetical protein KAX49_16590 [Halanaerobiales bacterium]|nr:hypothetical protein [Halanaerobiales bacterium]